MGELAQALPLFATLGLNLIGGVLKNKTKLPNKLIPLVNLGIATGATYVIPDLSVPEALMAVGGSTVLQQTTGYIKGKVKGGR